MFDGIPIQTLILDVPSDPDPHPSRSESPDELDVLKQAIDELERTLGAVGHDDAGGQTLDEPKHPTGGPHADGDGDTDIMSEELEDEDLFDQQTLDRRGRPLPIHNQTKPDPFEQLGTVDDAPVARSPGRSPAPLKKKITPKPRHPLPEENVEIRKAGNSSVEKSPGGASAPGRPGVPLERKGSDSLDLPQNPSLEATLASPIEEEPEPDLGFFSQAGLAFKLLIGGAFLALLAGMVRLSLNDPHHQDARADSLEETRQKVYSDVAATKETIEAFWNAPTLEEKLPFVWDAARVEPLMRAYYTSHPLPIALHLDESSLTPNRLGHMHSELPEKFPLAQVKDEIGKITPVVFRQGENRLLIDWEATVGFNAQSISTLLENGSDGPVIMRVLIIPNDYYNFAYSDSKRYHSFAIKTVDDDEPLCHGFAEKYSETGKTLNGLFTNRKPRRVAVALALQFAPNSGETLCVEIVRVESLHWVL